ncbi:MAG TPA: glycosyltransferase [Burkholderiales bacterium]|nr:glycosyltransferase [Burkholderiales bacterium]
MTPHDLRKRATPAGATGSTSAAGNAVAGHSVNDRISVVVLTHDRPDELMRTLEHLTTLPEQPQIIVVDNASADAVASRVMARFAPVRLVRCADNVGAAARNTGAAWVATDYVAFCDDDCWWAPGALARAVAILDANPRIAVLSARVLVGENAREDATCTAMACSRLPSAGLPGPALVGFMAGASVFRTAAFRQAGGYESRLFIGGEEELIALDLLSDEWKIVYAPMLTVHHYPSPQRDAPARRVLLARNAIWVGWLRLPARDAWRRTGHVLRDCARTGRLLYTMGVTLRGAPWVLRHRRCVAPQVMELLHRVQRDAGDDE